MKIVLIILGTLAVDWLGGFLLKYNKKKKQKRDDDLFIFKLEQILGDKNTASRDRLDDVKELCRMTKGEMASGAYIALASIYDIKDNGE